MNPKDLMYTQRRFSLLHFISFAVFAGVFVFGVYTYMAKMTLDAKVLDADSQIANLTTQVDELEAQNLSEVSLAQQLLANVEATEIKWSAVITDLIATTPLSVYYSSYSGSEDGKVTVAGLADSYAAVSDLIDALSGKDAFVGVFVPSVAATGSEDNPDMASFNLTFDYEE
ncbi:MAG: hypothetical protein UV80_C0001G0050 [Candidatus Peregrinibacteria bacterium GW2011_GWF2_43_17]|nr:MAG: hypothetical protein UV80_C0001G0050 [Candidatus Peregrinibacteria bacterium GW2011_GWF2_43_17]KKT20503.1 MAG: hypothetical protein UW03_C0003G0039 [Candidatus Peregrinibacteria bacterium GW2011_GWA2_43_8]HAU40292.1 hypothetical protein [Candidatus Peregrinibacteria bacterium]